MQDAEGTKEHGLRMDANRLADERKCIVPPAASPLIPLEFTDGNRDVITSEIEGAVHLRSFVFDPPPFAAPPSELGAKRTLRTRKGGLGSCCR